MVETGFRILISDRGERRAESEPTGRVRRSRKRKAKEKAGFLVSIFMHFEQARSRQFYYLDMSYESSESEESYTCS